MDQLATEDIVYGLFGIAVVLVVFFLIRKIASCLIKTVILAIVVAILGYVYFNLLEVEENDGPSIKIEQKK